jgi:hypothetical protein
MFGIKRLPSENPFSHILPAKTIVRDVENSLEVPSAPRKAFEKTICPL